MSPYNGPNGTWWKIVTAILPLLGGAIFAFATLKAEVGHLTEEMGTKANAAVVQANQEAILRELNGIEAKLDRISGVRVDRLR